MWALAACLLATIVRRRTEGMTLIVATTFMVITSFPVVLGALALLYADRNWSLLVFAALSTSVRGHHMFTTGAVDNRFFSLASTAIAVPGARQRFPKVTGRLLGEALGRWHAGLDGS